MQGTASARRELEAEWPPRPRLQQLRPLHESAALPGQQGAGATAAATAVSSSLSSGAHGSDLTAASTSMQRAAERMEWSSTLMNPELKPSLATARARHWARWSPATHAPAGPAAEGSGYPDEGSLHPDVGLDLRRGSAASETAGAALALAGSGRRESAPSRHPGGAHGGNHQAGPGTVGLGEPGFGHAGPAGRAMPLPAEEGFHPEQGYSLGGGSSGGLPGRRAWDGVLVMPGRSAAHGASGRDQAGLNGRGGVGWEGPSVGAANPDEEGDKGHAESAEQGGPEAQGAVRAAKPEGWLFGRRGGAAASAAEGAEDELAEDVDIKVQGVARAAYPQGGVSGSLGDAGSALEGSGADGLALAAVSDREVQGMPRAAGFPGRLVGGGRGQGTADELDLKGGEADLAAEEADSAVQGVAAATEFSGSVSPDRRYSSGGHRQGAADEVDVEEDRDPAAGKAEVQGRVAATGDPGRPARHRSGRGSATEQSRSEPESDAEDAGLAAEAADPEDQSFAVRAGASGRLSGRSASHRGSVLGQGNANPLGAEDDSLPATAYDAEGKGFEARGAAGALGRQGRSDAQYPASGAQGGAHADAGNLWRARAATDQGKAAGLAREAAARRDPDPVTHPGDRQRGFYRGSSGMEQALTEELQGRMNPEVGPGLDPVGRVGFGGGTEGDPHAEQAAANQRALGVLERRAAQAAAAVDSSEGATEDATAAWWGERSTPGSPAATQPRAEAGAEVDDDTGRADPNPETEASSEGADNPRAAWADSLGHGYQRGADPDGLGGFAGARAPSAPALDVEGADAGMLLDPPDTAALQDDNSKCDPGPGAHRPPALRVALAGSVAQTAMQQKRYMCHWSLAVGPWPNLAKPMSWACLHVER